MIRSMLAALCCLVALGQASSASDRHVLVISVDGLPAYLLDDPAASLPVIRGLMSAGVSASGMHVSNPSVTWPNHTTLMTGVHPEKHGVLFNGKLERDGAGQPVRVVPTRTQAELVRVPLLFDLLKEAGISSGAINWPCTRGSDSLVDNFPDVPDSLKYTTLELKEALERKGLLEPKFSTGRRDEVWADAARESILERKPRLLAVHLLGVDSAHHRFGPRSPGGYKAVAEADAQVGRIIEALDEAGIRDRTTILIVSDHGFLNVRKSLRPNAVLRREGLIREEGGKIVEARAQVIPEGGIGMIYLTDPATADRDRETILRLFRGAEGVAAVLEPADYPRYHLPNPGDHPGMADLILVGREGYSISGSTKGDDLLVEVDGASGAHGFISTEPLMDAVFVASGAGIKSGSKLGAVENIDVAPTVARLLGAPPIPADGRVLEEILELQD